MLKNLQNFVSIKILNIIRYINFAYLQHGHAQYDNRQHVHIFQTYLSLHVL